MTWFLLGTFVLIVVGYAVSCAVWPYAACLCCKGEGRHARADGKVWRYCRWCEGRGRRLRVGPRIWRRDD